VWVDGVNELESGERKKTTPLKINATRFIFHVTFDRSEIESYGFHRWKEEMKTNRNIYYAVF
jgi:hypothetical protein